MTINIGLKMWMETESHQKESYRCESRGVVEIDTALH